MKLRILDDTIRLRLDRHEVDELGAGGAVSATTHFPRAAFEYRLATGETLDARFHGGVMAVTVPAGRARDWAVNETDVSISGEAGSLSILVEKDFECLEPREGESQANRFSNPKAQS